MNHEYEDRLQEFGEGYTDYEADDLCKLIVHTADRLAALCDDEEAVDATMKVLHEALDMPALRADHEGDNSWRTVWLEIGTGDLERLPLAQKLTSLNAYAYYGLSPKSERGPCTIEDIRSVVETVAAAIRRPDADRPKTEQIDNTILAAQGRLALDENRSISLEQLAALARIGLKSIRNAAAPSSGSGLEVTDAMVTAASALRWLAARGDFKSSIWGMDRESEPTVEAIEGEILWVPFATDKTEFHPSHCLRAGHYKIGPKGAEREIADYREALDSLARMRPSAHWRRPNTAGNWGIVTAIGFRPRTVEELGLPPRTGEGQ